MVAGDLQREHESRRVVAAQGDFTIRQSDLERLGAGTRQADRALDSDIDRALINRRLTLNEVVRRAEAAGTDVPTYLRTQARLAGPAIDADAEQAVAERALGEVQLPPPRVAVVRTEDYDHAWCDGSPAAPVRLLAVIRADCGVCASQLCEINWLRAHVPGMDAEQVRFCVLAANDLGALAQPHPSPEGAAICDALMLARAVAQQPPEGAWRLLLRICAQPDPSAITWGLLQRWQRGVAADATSLAGADAVLKAQAESAQRLLGRDAPPRLFLQDRPLGGYCPRERLAGAISEAEALLQARELATELDPEMQSATSAGVMPQPARDDQP